LPRSPHGAAARRRKRAVHPVPRPQTSMARNTTSTPRARRRRCVSCHMPSRTYMVVHERRDHRIAVPRPDLSAALGRRTRAPPATPRAATPGRPTRSPVIAAGGARDRRARSCSARRCGARGTSSGRRRVGARAAGRPDGGGPVQATALSALGASAPTRRRPSPSRLLRAADPWSRLGAVEALRPPRRGARAAAGGPGDRRSRARCAWRRAAARTRARARCPRGRVTTSPRLLSRLRGLADRERRSRRGAGGAGGPPPARGRSGGRAGGASSGRCAGTRRRS
jgi:hypothetical protein